MFNILLAFVAGLVVGSAIAYWVGDGVVNYEND